MTLVSKMISKLPSSHACKHCHQHTADLSENMNIILTPNVTVFEVLEVLGPNVTVLEGPDMFPGRKTLCLNPAWLL